ncbi:hypothetical protein RND81_10G239300 [Saponaria officinalis]|uniref:DUF3615 domain-containing protein n=1 Tax=Saponaria officinalis TaxID=3572 RepID=A0AAW1I7V9_SAPOF
MEREGGDGGGRPSIAKTIPRMISPGEGKCSPARKIPKSKAKHVDDSSRDAEEQCRDYADAALRHLNYKENVDFELVKPCYFGGASVLRGLIFHVNFTAKRRADPDDPLQTFFAQIRLMSMSVRMDDRKIFVDCCVNLGPTHLLPYKVYLAGCQYCYSSVYHPIGGCEKLILGCKNDDVGWLYCDEVDESDSQSESYSDRSLEDSGGCAGSRSDTDV